MTVIIVCDVNLGSLYHARTFTPGQNRPNSNTVYNGTNLSFYLEYYNFYMHVMVL